MSLDGLSYCEIVDDSEIEVVAVDPHYDRRPTSGEKKPTGKAKSKRSSNTEGTWNTPLPTRTSRSFETCMHGSLHCVLGYCSQAMTPSYRQAAEEKPTVKPVTSATKTSDSTKENTSNAKDNNTANVVENSDKFAEGSKLLEGYAIAMAQSVQSKNTAISRGRVGAVASSSAPNAPSDRSIMKANGSKVVPSTSRTSMSTLRGFANAPLVLLRSSGAKMSSEDCKAKDSFNSVKPEDAPLNEDTLSSMYQKLMSVDEAAPARGSFYTLKRHSTSGVREYKPKRSALDTQMEYTRSWLAKGINENGNADNAMLRQQPDGGTLMSPSVKNRSWCTSETSEIARILSEYNRGATRQKSAVQVYGGASKDAKAGLATPSGKQPTKGSCFWYPATEENRDISADRGLDLSQGKWRKLSSLENASDQVVDKRPAASSESCQPTSSRDRPAGFSSYARERPAVTRKDLNKPPPGTLVSNAKPQEAASGYSKDEEEVMKTEDCLRELLENTAVLYCAANGVHQDDLSSYIDTLDSKQSIQWLETWNNSIA